MSSNSFGKIFKVTIFGESHGPMIGMVIDGCPAGVEIDEDFIQHELDRRRPGQSKITTQRQEEDRGQIVSGVFQGKTTGTPMAGIILNKDQRSNDYSHIAESFRPSHADFTYQEKYGHRDYRGGGRSSARETAARVFAGAIAKMVLNNFNIKILAYVSSVGDLEMKEDYLKVTEINRKKVESSIVRCPNEIMSKQMIALIESVQKKGDTIGGIISCVISGTPAGLGSPVFDKLHADLGKAMLSINAVKGFQYGAGFKGTRARGSEQNDLFELKKGIVKTKTNFSGGIQGGISNGMDITFQVAFKPVATIMQDQPTLNINSEKMTIKGKGRHDPCVLPRAVPIVEAMAALTLVDHLLRNRSSKL